MNYDNSAETCGLPKTNSNADEEFGNFLTFPFDQIWLFDQIILAIKFLYQALIPPNPTFPISPSSPSPHFTKTWSTPLSVIRSDWENKIVMMMTTMIACQFRIDMEEIFQRGAKAFLL